MRAGGEREAPGSILEATHVEELDYGEEEDGRVCSFSSLQEEESVVRPIHDEECLEVGTQTEGDTQIEKFERRQDRFEVEENAKDLAVQSTDEEALVGTCVPVDLPRSDGAIG